jgi:FkbM family methyltransferase
MPEISRPSAVAECPEESDEFLRRRSELDCFLACNQHREPVLYFGDAAYYKGYDLFLEFVAATPSACAIHAGRSYDAQQRSYFRYDVEGLRAQLTEENRLYETNAYVRSRRLKELLFGSIRLYITTHRLALSSSTVIQALELGKPVLVPDRGLLGYRVRKNNLGDVYKYESLSDLKQKAEKLWHSDLCRFSPVALVVGAFDGARDPTIEFIRKHQCGAILVEPQVRPFKRLCELMRLQSNIFLLNAAIDEVSGFRDMYCVTPRADELPSWTEELASFRSEHILSHEDRAPGVSKAFLTCKVPTMSFENLLDRYDVKSLDVLQIDAEGMDAQLLAWFPFDRIRPALLRYETVHMSAEEQRAVRIRLKELGYVIRNSGSPPTDDVAILF